MVGEKLTFGTGSGVPQWRRRADALLDVWASVHQHWRSGGVGYPPVAECCDLEHLPKLDPPRPEQGASIVPDIIADQSEKYYQGTPRKYERPVIQRCIRCELAYLSVEQALVAQRCPYWMRELLQVAYPLEGRFAHPYPSGYDPLREFESDEFLRATGGMLFGKYVDRARNQIKCNMVAEFARLLAGLS